MIQGRSHCKDDATGDKSFHSDGINTFEQGQVNARTLFSRNRCSHTTVHPLPVFSVLYTRHLRWSVPGGINNILAHKCACEARKQEIVARYLEAVLNAL